MLPVLWYRLPQRGNILFYRLHPVSGSPGLDVVVHYWRKRWSLRVLLPILSLFSSREGKYIHSYFRVNQVRSMKILSKHLPIPSMLISIPYPCNAPMNSLLQNWEPQSVLKMAGTPYLTTASCRQSMQNSVFIVSLKPQLRIFLLYRSMMAVR